MKVVINGAGVAGPALAYWLDRTGNEPMLVEQAPRLRTGGYLIDFWGVGYTVAERMGILSELREGGYSVQEVRIVDRDGRKAGGFSTDIMRRVAKDRFTSLPRSDLAAAIYRSVENRVETEFGNSIAAIEQNDSGVEVSFEQGTSREFDLVIGADGLHSTVRELVFGPESRFETHLGYWVAAFEAEGYHPRDELVYVSYSCPGREAARFALRDDRTMFFLMFVDRRMPGPDPRTVMARRAVLNEVFADAGWECPQILRAMDHAEEIYFDRVSQIQMNGWSKGRVMLIGDAAACVSLLAGEGSGLALTEAYVLAGELTRAAGDYQEAFRRYEGRIRPFIEGKQKSARKFASAFAPKTRAGIWVRNQVTKLLSVPAVADLLFTRNIRDDFDLPDYEM